MFVPLLTNAQESPYVPGDIIVKLYPNYSVETVVSGFSGAYNSLHFDKELSRVSNIQLIQFDAMKVNDGAFLEQLKQHPGVEAAQFNHYVEDRATVPTDPQFGSQWHHVDASDNDIDSDLAWDVTTGGTTAAGGHDIVVCVVEGGGADYNHPDLIGNHWTNTAEIDGNGIDDDGNGYIDDVNGWNAVSGNDNISSGNHGTAVSGMIGASANNGNGGVGVNWDVKIMQVQIGSLTEANVIAAYAYPQSLRDMWNTSGGAQGAFVVATNSSWGIDNANPASYPVWCAYYDDLGADGILNCGATANNNVNIDVVGDMPTGCSSDYMVAVTATNSSDVRTFSGYGATTIDLGAPGEDVWLPTGGGGYAFTSGTSFASPCTAGAIAMLYSAPCSTLASDAMTSPQATADLIRNAIMNGVDVIPGLVGECVTGGRLNVNNSLGLVVVSCGGCLEQWYIPDLALTTGPALFTCEPPTDYTLADQACAQNVIDNDPFCIDTNWDSLCQEAYDCCLADANGCTDSEACNFDSTAACDDGSCCFDPNCITIEMFDSFGDGWNGATYDITLDGVSVASGTLEDGEMGSDALCLADGCGYEITVGGGDYDTEITWTLNGVDGGSVSGNAPETISFSINGSLGCTDTTACNYDSTAACDDGSCTSSGCTDPTACNYDSTAGCDDGSCYEGDITTLSISTDCWGGEVSWNIDDAGGTTLYSADAGSILSSTTTTWNLCLTPGCYDFYINDSFGDGMFGSQYSSCAIDGDYNITDGSGDVLVQMTAINADYGTGAVHNFCLSTDNLGCTDTEACNYDSTATIDDGSCSYPGCTDTTACNYDSTAGCDDGLCLENDECGNCGGDDTAGCTDSTACNYDSTAGCDDGSCLQDDECGNCGGSDTSGCTDSTACNYDSTATCDDTSCDFDCQGCTDSTACNYDSTATDDDGSCLENDECGNCGGSDTSGCTNISACNYDSAAVCDNGSCEYLTCRGCTGQMACNYDSSASIDDGSCEYTSCAGCTYPSALEYDSTATIDDGSCSDCETVCPGDFDGNGLIDTGDLLDFLTYFGASCP